ncbi:MAG: glycosyltransferase family 2 protein [Ignavibacteria bacterium]
MFREYSQIKYYSERIKVSIIIVNFNGEKFLKDCFDSLSEQSFEDYEVIFVDNNSEDKSIEFLRQNYDSAGIKIYKAEKNLGFAGANNFGFKYCSGKYIVLLNNDTIVEKHWLKNLIECIESDENTGIAQSLVITEGIPLRYYEKNGTINLLGHNIMDVFEIDSDGTGEIFQANGCSMAIRKSLIESLDGLFPDEYFAYSEDTYLCFKVKFRGLKIIHTSKSVVHHKGGGTSGKFSFLFFYQERNRLLNFIIFFSDSFFIKYIPFLILNFIMKIFASFISEKYSASQLLKAYWWIISNRHWINQKRRSLNLMKAVNEESVLNYLSGKILNGNNAFQKAINWFSISYCKLVRLRIIENKITVK